MNKKEIKKAVVELRESGMTFEAISKYLIENFGVTRSRQAIQGMYKRAITQKDDCLESGQQAVAEDIINIYLLGYNRTEITSIVTSEKSEVKYSFVTSLLADESEYIESLRESKEEQVVQLLDNGATLDDIRERLKYLEVMPKEEALKAFVSKAFIKIIKANVIETIAEAYQVLDDRKCTRFILSNLDLDIQMKEVKAYLD